MREEYIIQAYSPSKHQTVREFNLEMGNPSITDQALAEKFADSFATRLNRQRYLKATDWIPKAEWQQLGVDTLGGHKT